MRSVRWRKVARDAWLHRSRTLLVVLAIAVGIAGAGSVLNTWSLLRRVTRDEFLATNPPSATLRLDAVDSSLLAAVRALDGVQGAEARRTLVASVQSGGAWRTAILFVAPDLATSTIGRVVPDRGTWPPPDGALVVEHSSLEFSELIVGDSADLRLGTNGAVRLPVVGVARDAGLAPGWMEHVVYGFITPATAARLGGASTLDELRIVARNDPMNRDANRQLATQVRAVAESMGRRVREVDVPVPGRHIHAAQMDSLLMTQGAFGLLALLLSAFLVVNLVTAMLTGQVREIGVMKTLGASDGQLSVMYLALALGLGLVACAVAVPLAMVAGRAYAEFSSSLLNFSVIGVAIPAWSIALQVAVGMLMPVAAAAIPVWRGCRMPVAAALRDLGVTDAHVRASGRLLRIPGLSRPTLLSLRNTFRRRQRTTLTLVTLALGGAVFLGALSLRTGIRDSVAMIYGSTFKHDLTVRFEKRHPMAVLEAAGRRTSGVVTAEAWTAVRASMRGPDSLPRTSFALTGLPPATMLVGFTVRAGRALAAGDDSALVVSRTLADDDPSLVPGARVTLVIAGRSTRWQVVGIVNAGPGENAWTTREGIARATGDTTSASLVIKAAPMSVAEQSDLIQRLRDDLERAGLLVASTSLVQANREVLEDHLLMVAGFLVVMAQLMLVVGGLGLASTMSLSVLERTREIGVLRAIGAQHGAILAMIQVEGLVISLLAWLLAVPLSIPLGALLGRAFGQIMFEVPVRWVPEGWPVLAWLGVAVVVSLLACLWPARRAMQVTTAAALAYE